MINRDELLRFRIDNYLNKNQAPIREENVGIGTLVIRQVTEKDITIGTFATSKTAFKRGARNYFVETPIIGEKFRKQLWLPAIQWLGSSIVNQREIIATHEDPSRRFAAWQEAQITINDLEGYDQYDPANQKLYDLADSTLKLIEANDSRFNFTIEKPKNQ